MKLQRILLIIPCLLIAFVVMAQNADYNPEPNTPQDNWCYVGGVWGDGRCNDSDPFTTAYNWMIGWYMPRCEANIFPQDKLPAPCIVPETDDDDSNSSSRQSGGGGWSDGTIGGDGCTLETGDLEPDSDVDDMADWWEIEYFCTLSHDGSADGDNDLCTDLCEYRQGTNPLDKDTDNDDLLDGEELPGSSPTAADTDNDGFDDGEEVAAGSNPRDATSTPDTVGG